MVENVKNDLNKKFIIFSSRSILKTGKVVKKV